MDLNDAKAECERWLAYLAREQKRTFGLQKLASERRSGQCDDGEARRRIVAMEREVGVYNGARLADAVRVILGAVAEIKRQEKQLYRLGNELAKDKLEIGRLRLLLKRWVVSCDHEEHDLLAESRREIENNPDVS